MDTAELLKKVRRIELKIKSLSKNILSGEYHSAFKGRGMSFVKFAVTNMETMLEILTGMLPQGPMNISSKYLKKKGNLPL